MKSLYHEVVQMMYLASYFFHLCVSCPNFSSLVLGLVRFVSLFEVGLFALVDSNYSARYCHIIVPPYPSPLR
jgi:hypothetical protein